MALMLVMVILIWLVPKTEEKDEYKIEDSEVQETLKDSWNKRKKAGYMYICEPVVHIFVYI